MLRTLGGRPAALGLVLVGQGVGCRELESIEASELPRCAAADR